MSRESDEGRSEQAQRLADRRHFLALGAKVAAVMATFGVTGTAGAQIAARQMQKSDKVQFFLNKGIDSASKRSMMEEARKAQLPEEQMKALDKLTDGDLRALKAIKMKIPSPEEIMAGDNYGVIVY